jgi:DNA repair protein RadC
MSGHLLGIAAAAALAAAGLIRKGSAAALGPVTNEDLADALRAYRPPTGSAARRKAEAFPQELPGQLRIPGFSDEELVRLGLAREKIEAQPPKKKPRRRRAVDLDAEADRIAEQVLVDEAASLAMLELQKQATEDLHEQGQRVRRGLTLQPQRDPRSEGPWELFLRSNPSDVSDQVLVALLLADGTGDPMERARVLLDQAMGSLGQIVEGSFGEDAGVPEATRARLIAAAELSRRAELRQMFATKGRVKADSPESAVEFLRRMSSGPQEVASAIYLDSQGIVIGYRVLSRGSSKFTLVDPVEIFRPAVVLRARSVLLAHQHPSGDPQPSQPDISATRSLIEVGRALQIPLSDHIIVGNNSHFSIRANGLLPFVL